MQSKQKKILENTKIFTCFFLYNEKNLFVDFFLYYFNKFFKNPVTGALKNTLKLQNALQSIN
jgi:hypothetical protein